MLHGRPVCSFARVLRLVLTWIEDRLSSIVTASVRHPRETLTQTLPTSSRRLPIPRATSQASSRVRSSGRHFALTSVPPDADSPSRIRRMLSLPESLPSLSPSHTSSCPVLSRCRVGERGRLPAGHGCCVSRAFVGLILAHGTRNGAPTLRVCGQASPAAHHWIFFRRSHLPIQSSNRRKP